ncbi:16S rRNA (uracil(1498)-N(3))-methyltransferase [Maledivibacter halophilus]|uniref:Ribosomal RNA small subunit methyltransferase E n=1 Tax=Maledivibacter halophilus TaxID=36842 RepID=A0A1T5LUW3_9FIRM|nr:16S rRNA (uracil(1498)-N(3))-methyltransferase [Maledivibacter halophilus]SKC79644.1 16S rRNA (uracil1498-N3)-methyltransferase [Maledivibacter halophilus]
MNRFFVNKNNVFEEKNIIIIDSPEDLKHISKVLRLSEGDNIEICNKENIDYLAQISNIDKKQIECKIVRKYTSKTEAPIEIVLFQSIPKSNKMDLIIQKNVEIGVKKIIPIISDRCVVKIKDRTSEEKKVERWQKIAYEAAKQCKRGIIPTIGSMVEIQDLIKVFDDFDMIIIPYEEEKDNGIKKVVANRKGVKKVGIIIGPEGGFTKDEVENLVSSGAISVSLGPRILRTETAGLVTTSILMYELGDLGGN